MTVATTTSTVTYLGNGATTVFTFPFIADSTDYISVYIQASNGDVTLLNPVQYSVTLNPLPAGGLWSIGGSVTYPLSGSPLAVGKKITIERGVPYTQNVSINNQGAFYPQVVEQALDILELQIQQLETGVLYSLKFPVSDGVLPNDLPPAAERVGYVLGFDSSGQPEMVPNNNITITNNVVTQVKDSFSQPALNYLNSPPGSPVNGDRYLIGNTPTGAWTGKKGLLAEWDTSLAPPAWSFSPTPDQGQTIYNKTAGIWYIYRNTWWNKVVSEVPNAMYQDFGDVPDNTSVSGLILASGHTLSPEGPGAASTTVVNGRIEPTDNIYPTVLWPYKNTRMGMKYAWRVGHEGTGAVTLAAGTKVSGAIITKMIHTEYLYQSYGDMSLWGGVRRTPDGMGGFLPYLATAGIQFHYRNTDTNYPLLTNQIQYSEQYINGCNVECHGSYGYFLDSYTDDMISGLCGDDASGNLGYLYFQSGAVLSPNLPYIYMIFAEPIAATEDLPNPKYLASASGLPQSLSKTLTWGGGAQELCRFTSQQFYNYAFTVDVCVATSGSIPGYASATRKYIINVNNYNGSVVPSILAVSTELQTSVNGATATVTNAFTITTSGDIVILNANPTRTGADTTSTPQVTYVISPIVGNVTFS